VPHVEASFVQRPRGAREPGAFRVVSQQRDHRVAKSFRRIREPHRYEAHGVALSPDRLGEPSVGGHDRHAVGQRRHRAAVPSAHTVRVRLHEDVARTQPQ
jgi:hypothetical protein